ncbi:alpha/beta hydrolase [Erythrobacter sp. 3-20A1M]|uniref:alpha/beta hydrolase n=1 Tax=Erythrobacter sp. 3-20A1M TaxID=2653850 RepID=UPI00203EC715|nr:alpha/beta fold hydrolase [Erythrobacter sp. 3-20A1M]
MSMAIGLALALGGVAAAPAATAPDTPMERAITAPGPKGDLAGTLREAAGDGDAPVVLILPGSGPTDRDGNNPMGLKAETYRYLADDLAARGIASVRIDKRGMFGSSAAGSPEDVTIGAYAADTRSWIDAIREETGAGCVWLLGHSEGGLIALSSAAQSGEGVCGLILVAAPGRPLQDIIREQLRANPANAFLLKDADRIIDALVAGETVPDSEIPAPLLPLFRESIQGFVRSEFALDPAELAKATDLPLLLIYGGRDIQVAPTDGERLAAARPDATLATFPDMSHVLKSVAGDGMQANLATYADPDLPLTDGVGEAIAAFVKVAPKR